jgi:hypothetical protein
MLKSREHSAKGRIPHERHAYQPDTAGFWDSRLYDRQQRPAASNTVHGKTQPEGQAEIKNGRSAFRPFFYSISFRY